MKNRNLFPESNVNRKFSMKWSLQKNVTLMFVAALIVLVLIGIISYRTTRQMVRSIDQVSTSHAIILHLKSIVGGITEAESQTRGYVLGGDPDILDRMTVLADSIDSLLHELLAMTSGRTAVYRHVLSLDSLSHLRLGQLNERIVLYQTKGPAVAQLPFHTSRGRALMEGIRAIAVSIEREQRDLLSQQSRETNETVLQTVIIIIVGNLAGFVLLLMVLFLLNREINSRHQIEHALAESEQKFRLLVESANDIFYRTDHQGRYFYVNPIGLKLTGYSEEDVIGKHYSSIIHKDYKADIERFYRKQLLEHLPNTYREFPIIKKDGNPLWVGQNVQILADQGRVIGFQALARDISDRKRAEEERDRYFNLSLDFLCVTGFDGYLKHINPTWERNLGYSHEELLREPFLHFVHPDDVAATRSQVEKVIQGEDLHAFETRFRRKDGTYLWTEWTATPYLDQQIIYAVGRDTSERKRIEQRLKESILFQNAILNGADYSIISTSTDGTILSFNSAAQRLLGYTPEEVVGKVTPAILHDPQEVIRRAESLSLELGRKIEPGFEVFVAKPKMGITEELEWTYLRKDRSRFPVLLSVTALRDSTGEISGFMGIASDITERVRTRRELELAKEAAESATRAKSQFLAMMSHEIRTPMNGVIGMTELLGGTELTPQQQEYLDTIKRSGESLLTIINDILDFSKFESGTVELERRPFDPRTCIEESFDVVAQKALQKNLDLLYLVDPQIPPYLIGDENRLRQVLINLVGNAIKFTEKGEIVIQVQVQEQTGETITLHYSIKDTGIGIPPDRIERLFKPFSQVDSSTTRKYGGTGLGLAICARLAEAMGGTIWVESTPGKGSVFHFTIKAGTTPAETALPRMYLKGNNDELAGKRVLIVDDNATNIHILTLQCQQWGLFARGTDSPGTALEWIRKGDPFDIGILDQNMEGMNGFMLAENIRKFRTEEALPLLLLSSSTELPPGNDARRLFSAIVTKPVKQSQLFNLVTSALGGTPAQPTKPLRQSGQIPHVESPGLEILVAEDNEVNQQLMRHVLKQLGYVPKIVPNGLEAIQALEARRFDVVLMDVQMPVMDGLEATRKIVERWKKPERPAIIALTADAMQGDRDKCLEAGMDDYLTKPIHLDKLRETLHRVAHGQSAAVAPSIQDSNSHTSLEESVLARLRELGLDENPEFFIELLETYVPAMDTHLSALFQAFEEKNARKLHYAAHSLKGSSLNIGAKAFGALCKTIEDQATAGSVEIVGSMSEQVQREFHHLREAITSIQKFLKENQRRSSSNSTGPARP